MKEKEMPLEERIEKIFESGWVNEFNYLEQLMQETRSCLYKLQQELQEIKKEHSIMKEFIYENGLWEKFLNDDRFIEHLRSE